MLNPKGGRHSLEAEMSCLGAMMLDDRAIHQAKGIITGESFYLPYHKIIFEAMVSLSLKRISVDFVTMMDELGEDRLNAIGGVDYLIRITEQTPSTANVQYYAGIVAERHKLRLLDTLAKQISEMANDDGKDSGEILAFASNGLRSCLDNSQETPMKHLAEISLHSEEGDGVPTGLRLIDESVTTGGLPKGQLTIIAGKQKHGKTPLMTQIAHHAATECGLNIVYGLFSDLTPSQWKRRLVKLLSGWGVQPSSLSQLESYNDAVDSVNDPFLNIHVYDGMANRNAGTVEAFASYVQALSATIPVSLVCVDYLQVVKTATPMHSMHERMSYVADYLNSEARAMPGAAWVVGSQLSGGAGETKARYSPEAEQHCGLMIEIGRDIQQKPIGNSTLVPAELIIKYSRFGESGVTEHWWDTRHLRFISDGPLTKGMTWIKEWK